MSPLNSVHVKFLGNGICQRNLMLVANPNYVLGEGDT